MQEFSAAYKAPVDLSYLREITDGEKLLEKELFALFLTNTENYFKTLFKRCSDGEDLEWRRISHEFRGACASIGAYKLEHICSQSQHLYQAPATEKHAILTQVSDELEVVKRFLSSIY